MKDDQTTNQQIQTKKGERNKKGKETGSMVDDVGVTDDRNEHEYIHTFGFRRGMLIIIVIIKIINKMMKTKPNRLSER